MKIDVGRIKYIIGSMKSSTAKKVSITFPAEMERELQKVAREEQRTLSGVLQEAARFFLNTKEWESLQKQASLKAVAAGVRSEDDVDQLIHDMRTKR